MISVRDVAIVPTGTDDASVDDYRDHPAADGVDVGHGVTIERLSEDEYELMMAACRPRGHFFFAVQQWGQRYAFVRRVELDAYEESEYGWDDDQVLSSAIAMSRLVRDNAHCAEFAGRIVDHEDGEQQVIPLYAFESRLAYRYGRERDWLDAAGRGWRAADAPRQLPSGRAELALTCASRDPQLRACIADALPLRVAAASRDGARSAAEHVLGACQQAVPRAGARPRRRARH